MFEGVDVIICKCYASMGGDIYLIKRCSITFTITNCEGEGENTGEESSNN